MYIPIQSSVGVQKSEEDAVSLVVGGMHDIEEVLTDQTERENIKKY